MYKIGYPFWKSFARMGVPLSIRVNVVQDDEAGVFVATSDDLSGLVCEAATFKELIVEVNAGIQTLLEYHLENKLPQQPVAARPDMRLCAA